MNSPLCSDLLRCTDVLFLIFNQVRMYEAFTWSATEGMAVEIWQPVAAATNMNYSEFVYATDSFCPVITTWLQLTQLAAVY
jgi:hypothetical protein